MSAYKTLQWFRERELERAAWLAAIARNGFSTLVRWESRWLPCVDDEGQACEECRLMPVLVERTSLDVSNPGRVDYSGPAFRYVPTRVTELPVRRWPTNWPKDAPTETETLRRRRIEAIRRACHVDPAKASATPKWVEPRAVA